VKRWFYWTLVAAVIAAHVVVAWSSLTRTALWEDEAFNLTVPRNLLDGLGYTSDGTLSGSTLTPFDPRISTGPVVLVPIAGLLALGADLVVGARLIPLAYYAALLVAVGLIGRRLGGRWGALAAVAVPLLFTAASPPSPIQGPSDVLGEIPAAALLAWATVVVRRRPWLAGLLLGLAIQAKYISLLAAPALVVAVVLGCAGASWGRRLRALLLPAALAVLPTALMELVALISLGAASFVQHLRTTAGFLLGGGQVGFHTTLPEKLVALASSWWMPPVLVFLTAAVLLAAGVAGTVALARSGRSLWRELASDRGQLIVIGLLGLGAFVGWWSLASHLPLWVRHPAPGVYAFAPVLAAGVVAALQLLWHAPAVGRGRALSRTVATLGGVVLIGSMATSAVLATSTAVGRADALGAQRTVAERLAAGVEADWVTTGWGGTVSLAVLGGFHAAMLDASPENIAGYPRLLIGEADACGGATVLSQAPGYVVCAAR
jgi:hypothetical protein